MRLVVVLWSFLPSLLNTSKGVLYSACHSPSLSEALMPLVRISCAGLGVGLSLVVFVLVMLGISSNGNRGNLKKMVAPGMLEAMRIFHPKAIPNNSRCCGKHEKRFHHKGRGIGIPESQNYSVFFQMVMLMLSHNGFKSGSSIPSLGTCLSSMRIAFLNQSSASLSWPSWAQ